jgi:hypothetical protein
VGINHRESLADQTIYSSFVLRHPAEGAHCAECGRTLEIGSKVWTLNTDCFCSRACRHQHVIYEGALAIDAEIGEQIDQE